MSEAWARDYGRFSRGVHERLLKGGAEYQDRSFDLDPLALLSEIEQELLDVSGWSFVLWSRLQRLRERLGDLDVKGGEDHGERG